MKSASAGRSESNATLAAQPAHEEELEMKLSAFLREFNISRKNSQIYPSGHVQIAQGLNRIHRLLIPLLDELGNLEFGVAGDTLLAFGRSLESKNGIYKEIAISLKAFDIASIAFSRGIRQAELAVLFELLATDPETVGDQGGIQTALSRADIGHVVLRQVDYGKLHHTDEEAVRKSEEVEADQENLWQHFILHSMSDTLVAGNQGVVLDHKRPPSPAALARYLNEGTVNAQSVLESYAHTMQESFSGSDSDPSEAVDSRVYAKRLNALLNELHPNLRRQFLSVTYHQCAASGSAAPVESFLSGLSNIFVIEMLRQANKDGEELSPSLLNLVYKIVNIQDGLSSDDPGKAIDPAAIDGGAIPDPDKYTELRRLFKREDYESYIPDTYGEMLKSLSGEGLSRDDEGEDNPYLEEILPTLDEAHINSRIATALLTILENQTRQDEYEAYADRIFQMTNDLLNSGNFSSLLAFMETLERHQEEKSDAIRETASQIRDRFQEESFISRTVAAFYHWSDQEKPGAGELILALGPKVVPELLVLYVKMEKPEKAPELFDILSHFPEYVCDEARKRLNDSRPLIVKHLIVLIRQLGCRESAEAIRKLMGHPNGMVRMEGLESLVHFKDPRAPFFLRKYLNSAKETEYGPAIKLAGKYKVSEILDDLIAMLRRFGLSRSDFDKNEMIISALGRIGDSRVVPVLSKLAKTKWGLYPGERQRMNLSLYKSLVGYKRSSVMPLIKYGRNYGNQGIKEICINLIKNPELLN